MITVSDSFFVMLNTYINTGIHHHNANERIKKEIEDLISQYPNKESLYADLHIMQKSTFILDSETGFIKAII